MIDITGVNLVKLVQKAYDLSVPLGLGALHFTPKPLSDEEAQEIIDAFKDDGQVVVALDYVKGRACKLTVFRHEDKWEIGNDWFDHTDSQLQELLQHVGIEVEPE